MIELQFIISKNPTYRLAPPYVEIAIVPTKTNWQ